MEYERRDESLQGMMKYTTHDEIYKACRTLLETIRAHSSNEEVRIEKIDFL
jgi:hypothetical protein